MAGLSSLVNLVLLLCVIFMAPWAASAALVKRRFTVGNQTVTRLCNQHTIVTVNRKFPGPTIFVREGDNLVVRVKNKSPYNLTLHWHGVRQLTSGWADGPAYITQCPITPGNKFTYNFTITGQEGTLWWHAHISYLRATVHGALVISPRTGNAFPFPTPDAQIRIILGEWWDANVEDVIATAIQTGGVPDESDAFTINSQPGDFFPCSKNDTTRILVEAGKTYLLRIVNAAMNNALFFKIAQHNMTVVAIDAVYTKQYETDLLLIQPGNTMDVLLTTSQRSGLFYMGARVYISQPQPLTFTNITATAILQYNGSSSSVPVLPSFPAFNDTQAAFKFSTDQRSLRSSVRQTVDVEMFITEGFGLVSCPNNACAGIGGSRAVGTFNNISSITTDNRCHARWKPVTLPCGPSAHFCKLQCSKPKIFSPLFYSLDKRKNDMGSACNSISVSPTRRIPSESHTLSTRAKGKGSDLRYDGGDEDEGGFSGRRRGGRGKGKGDKIYALGRLMTTILRHKAEKLGLNIRSDGYVPLDKLLKLREVTFSGIPLCSHTVDDVKEAVKNDNKQRFSLLEENGHLYIRANQGHTLKVIESEELLMPISSIEEVPVCVHGTYRKNLESILKTGLRRMQRRHVHFATGLPHDGDVISGMRRDVEILIFLDVELALKDGMKLYLSDNKVLLTEGFDGTVPCRYFAKIETWPKREPIS